MSDKETLQKALVPVLDIVKDIDPSDPEAKAKLTAKLPLESELLQGIHAILKEGLAQGTLGTRENAGIKFTRVQKATDTTPSIDFVHMNAPGPGHVHPDGEIEICFVHDGDPTFDGNPPGWTVYGPGSWHEPTVAGGVMDILYFLPKGAIEFKDAP